MYRSAAWRIDLLLHSRAKMVPLLSLLLYYIVCTIGFVGKNWHKVILILSRTSCTNLEWGKNFDDFPATSQDLHGINSGWTVHCTGCSCFLEKEYNVIANYLKGQEFPSDHVACE